MAEFFDVFISYASADRAWASKLAGELAGRGIKAFFDQASLREGEGWEAQIQASLLGSRHLICLWSGKANASPWVHRELATFSVRPQAPGESSGWLPMLNLDQQANAYASRQQFAVEPVKQAYAAGIDTLAAGEWLPLVDRIQAAIKRDKDAISIPVALLTLTREQAQNLTPAERDQIKARLGLDPATLTDRYGKTRRDWQPFGDGTSVDLVLDGVRKRINQRLQPRTIGWELPDERFWTEFSAAQAFAASMLQARVGAIVIDPVALSLALVQARIGLFTACLRVENVAIMVVPPFAATELTTCFRRWVEEFASAIVQPYFEPPMEPGASFVARCGIGVDDADEIRRLMQMSVAQFLRLGSGHAQPASAILGN